MSQSSANFEQTLAINPHDGTAHNGTAWYEQGDALANSGKYAEALNCFERSLQLKPDYAAAWVFRGVVLIHLDRYAEAITSCDRAIELSSGDREAWLFRGVALQRLGRYREAYASYDRANHQEQFSWRQHQKLKKLWRKLAQWRQQGQHVPAE